MASMNPDIVVFNKATVSLNLDLGLFIAAMQRFVNECVVPAWGTPARLVEAQGFVAGAWALAFLDDSDYANNLGYHQLTPDGLPFSRVFVKTNNRYGASITVTASHELVEMLVDPALNLMSTGPDEKAGYAYEAADPVRDESLAFVLDEFKMSNFVYPSYFEMSRTGVATRFDYQRTVAQPFQQIPGGFQQVFKDGKWDDVWAPGSDKDALPPEYRSEMRNLPARSWRRSST